MNETAKSLIIAIVHLSVFCVFIWLWKRDHKWKDIAKNSESYALSIWSLFVHYSSRFVAVVFILYTLIFGLLWLFVAILHSSS